MLSLLRSRSTLQILFRFFCYACFDICRYRLSCGALGVFVPPSLFYPLHPTTIARPRRTCRTINHSDHPRPAFPFTYIPSRSCSRTHSYITVAPFRHSVCSIIIHPSMCPFFLVLFRTSTRTVLLDCFLSVHTRQHACPLAYARLFLSM